MIVIMSCSHLAPGPHPNVISCVHFPRQEPCHARKFLQFLKNATQLAFRYVMSFLTRVTLTLRPHDTTTWHPPSFY
jgi:hypothetical protein